MVEDGSAEASQKGTKRRTRTDTHTWCHNVRLDSAICGRAIGGIVGHALVDGQRAAGGAVHHREVNTFSVTAASGGQGVESGRAVYGGDAWHDDVEQVQDEPRQGG